MHVNLAQIIKLFVLGNLAVEGTAVRLERGSSLIADQISTDNLKELLQCSGAFGSSVFYPILDLLLVDQGCPFLRWIRSQR